MTVTMTASGAQLLLLALCVYRGSALQQSAPRVRLSFKGEFFAKGPWTVGIVNSLFVWLVQISHWRTHRLVHTPTH